ncbi:MAG: DEAD/DEAH box helicase [Candidatus Hodarchaeota archaeon]
MLIESLALDDRIKKVIIEQDGIKELFPPQIEAINQGLLTGENLVISIPTAAGKTLLAELAALKHVIELGGKVIYLCPLRALASEKYNNLKRFETLGIRVAVTSGDYDSADSYLPRYDIIVSTNEKMDALLRHQVSWIRDQVSLVVIDECHLLNDQHRGPTLEILMARLLTENTHSQILALSATIGNADDLAEWLKAELVQSDWRPVPLIEGIYFEDQIIFSDYTSREIPFRRKNQLANIALDSVHSQEQILIFTPSRRSAVSSAERIGKDIEPLIEPREAKHLADLSSQIIRNLSDPLSLKLAETIKRGVTFHHAGLNSRQRDLVEKAFKKGLIKVLCATPTLCLSEETMIWHGISQTKVSQLDNVQSVFTLQENSLVPMKGARININHNYSNLLEILSVSGYNIKVTPNHKVLIKRNNQKMILRAGLICKGDKIATIGKLKLEKPKQYRIEDFIDNFDIDVGELDFDSSFAYFIGLMLGDGYSGAETNGGKILFKGSPSIVNSDEETLNHCRNICTTLNVSARRSINHYGTPKLVMGKNKWFRTFLVYCGVKKSDRKRISEKIMEMELENIASLLKGLFDADGYVNKGRSVGFANTSEILVKQVQKLLLRFGIVCRFRERRENFMRIGEKKYKTKKYYELLISQKKCLIAFNKSIGFGVQRKQCDLIEFISEIKSNIYYLSCPKCKYKIFKDLFGGRTKSQKAWGKQKLEIIRLLGIKGELGSRKIKEILGFEPKKGKRRLNHHYELIIKRKVGKISKTEWFWSLNSLGEWIFHNFLEIDNNNFDDMFKLRNCPLCNKSIEYSLKKGWRDSDFDGDIFWDLVRSVKRTQKESPVYDVVLPDYPKNDHMFVANGFIVHNSAGVNLPAKRVVVSSVYRYSIEEGSYPIKTLEYKQMSGRAGRPQFDSEGEALLLAKQERAVNWLMDRYILREPEAVYSKLAAKPALRRAILGLISSKVVNSVSDLLQFFEKTFYGFQFEAVFLEGKIREIIDLFIGWEMIKPLDANETLEVTFYGLRVSQLYLDPETAASIAEGLVRAIEKSMSKIHPVALLDLIMGTPDMVTLSFRKSDEKITVKRFERFTSRLIQDVPEPMDIEYEFRLRDFHTVLFLWDWIKELPIERLIMRYKIGSGDIQRIVETATWIISATAEIAQLKRRKNEKYQTYLKAALSLSDRVKYGIKSDAISLTRIKGIGRKRARILLEHGIRDINMLLKLNVSDLSQIPGFGQELARITLESAKELTEPIKTGLEVDLEDFFD